MKYYTEEELAIPSYKGTVYQRILENNRDYQSNTALIYFGKKISYRELFDNTEKCRKALFSYGVKAGDKVALLVSSTPEVIYVILALNRIGAVADLINPLFDADQIIDRINETGAKLLFVLDKLFGKMENMFPKLCIETAIVIPVSGSMTPLMRIAIDLKIGGKITYSSNVILYSDFVSKENESIKDVPDCDYKPDTPFVMVYSSGTTGASKGIVLTNDGINVTISHYMDMQYERDHIFLQMIPVWFSTGIVFSLFMPLTLGISCVLEPVFSKETFAKDIKKYKPHITLAATSLWLYAVESKELRNADLSNFTYPSSGGELLSEDKEELINRWIRDHGGRCSICKGYGMCELGSTVTASCNRHNKPGSQGYPIKGVTVAAFDMDSDEEQPYNHRGEIRVLSPARMKEYFDNPKATEEFFYTDKDGNKWGRTGDIGYIDEDGDLFILGRANDFYISTVGEKIYCFDVEKVIMESGQVDQCEVTALNQKDENGYDVPVAFLIPKQGDDSSNLIGDLHECLKEHMDEASMLKAYKIVDVFPVKNNGKRDMEKLRNETEGFIKNS